MRITLTTLALLLHHHDAMAQKASKVPKQGSKMGKGKSGKGSKCTSSNSFNSTGLKSAVDDYFDQGCLTNATCEIILQYGDIEGWKTCRVANMTNLFATGEVVDDDDFVSAAQAAEFNKPLNNWDMSSVTDMAFMFHGQHYFNQPLKDWNTGQVVDMRFMFSNAKAFNQPISGWDVSKVTDLRSMFNGAEKYNQPMNDWDVSKVAYMTGMFYTAKAFNQPLSDWDVSSVQTTRVMFGNAAAFNQNLCVWGKVKSFPLQFSQSEDMFGGSGCTEKAEPSSAQGGSFCAACSGVFV